MRCGRPCRGAELPGRRRLGVGTGSRRDDDVAVNPHLPLPPHATDPLALCLPSVSPLPPGQSVEAPFDLATTFGTTVPLLFLSRLFSLYSRLTDSPTPRAGASAPVAPCFPLVHPGSQPAPGHTHLVLYLQEACDKQHATTSRVRKNKSAYWGAPALFPMLGLVYWLYE